MARRSCNPGPWEVLSASRYAWAAARDTLERLDLTDLDDLFEDVAILVEGRIVWHDSVARFMAFGTVGSPRAAESAYLHIVGAG